MDQCPDCYAVLGVSPGVTPEEAHARYRELVRALHPDCWESPAATAAMARVNAAYGELSARLEGRPAVAVPADPPPGPDAASVPALALAAAGCAAYRMAAIGLAGPGGRLDLRA